MASTVKDASDAVCDALDSMASIGIGPLDLNDAMARREALASARSALLDFARAIVAEVKAPQTPAAEPIACCDVTCTDEVLRVDGVFAREAMQEPEQDEALTPEPTGGKQVDEDIERIRAQRRALPAFFAANPDLAGCRCHADRDGDCTWERCPQNRDDEPLTTGRHCPLDLAMPDDDR